MSLENLLVNSNKFDKLKLLIVNIAQSLSEVANIVVADYRREFEYVTSCVNRFNGQMIASLRDTFLLKLVSGKMRVQNG